MVRESKESSGTQLCPTFAKWLIDAVRKVRYQKQRPNLFRITNAIRQHQNVSPEKIAEQLELAVDEGHIIKTFNQGEYTYRDPAMVLKLQNRQLEVRKNTDLRKCVVRAIRELGEPGGSSLKSITSYVQRIYKLKVVDSADLTAIIKNSLKAAIAAEQVSLEGRLYVLTGKAPVFKPQRRYPREVVEQEQTRAFLVDIKDKTKVCVDIWLRFISVFFFLKTIIICLSFTEEGQASPLVQLLSWFSWEEQAWQPRKSYIMFRLWQ